MTCECRLSPSGPLGSLGCLASLTHAIGDGHGELDDPAAISLSGRAGVLHERVNNPNLRGVLSSGNDPCSVRLSQQWLQLVAQCPCSELECSTPSADTTLDTTPSVADSFYSLLPQIPQLHPRIPTYTNRSIPQTQNTNNPTN